MNIICENIANALHAGRGVVLLSVCERRGSAPRGLGAVMLALEDGSTQGTVGGGAVEYAALQESKTLFESRDSRMLFYRLSASELAEAGMICGGSVRVLAQYIGPSEQNLGLFDGLMQARDAGLPAALVRRISDGCVTDMGWWDGSKLHGMKAALPENPGERAWLSEDGTLLYEPASLGTRALLFGGGHVSQKLAPLLEFVGFRLVICEDRAAFAEPSLFPASAQVRLGDFSRLDSFLTVMPEDFAVVITRGHQADYSILRQLLATEARYIGCIGSRRKVALTRERLIADGFTEQDFERVHTPIGLPIGAETPEEIAVSIVAEMIQARAGL